MVATIQYIEQLIAMLDQAARACRQAPGRSGNIVDLSKDTADEIMVTADLHGNRPNFNAIRRLADLAHRPRRHLVLQEVCHGGPAYSASGGCMSHMMLEDVAKLQAEFPAQVHFLMSNHELAELTDYPIVKNQKMLNLTFRFGMQEMYGPATERVREAYLPFLRNLPLAVRLDRRIWISHTIPERVDQRGFDTELLERWLTESDFSEQSALFSFVWGRDFRQENADAFAKLVGAEVMIHGHEPCPEGFATPNSRQVILDCQGDRACYVLLPLGKPLTQQQIVERIKPLR